MEGKKGCGALLMHNDIILDIILNLQEIVQISGGWSEDLLLEFYHRPARFFDGIARAVSLELEREKFVHGSTFHVLG